MTADTTAVPCASRTDARLKGAWCHQLSAADCTSHWAREAGGLQRRFACGVSNGACRRGAPCSDGPPVPSSAAEAGLGGDGSDGGACVDAPGWRNFWQLDCAAYRSLGYCRGGALVNASAGGTLFGSPELACCGCRSNGPRRASQALELPETNGVVPRQRLFFATHAVDATDARLLRHYQRDLSRLPHTQLWLLHYVEGAGSRDDDDPSVPPSRATVGALRRLGLRTCLWRQRDLFRVFPRMEAALRSSAGYARTSVMVRRYYFFTASLLVWNATFGHALPTDLWWRIEPDVLYSGRLSALVVRSLQAFPRDVDLLLPNIRPANRNNPSRTWQLSSSDSQWHANRELLAGVDERHWLHSLVAIGRYSSRFLRAMAARWGAGVVGYEEILLPLTCSTLGEPHCRMASWQEGDWRTWREGGGERPHLHHANASGCAEFLEARVRASNALWHPVKNRSCLVSWLDANATVGGGAGGFFW